MSDDDLEKLGERLYRKGEKFERRFEAPSFRQETPRSAEEAREPDEIKTLGEPAKPSVFSRNIKIAVIGIVVLCVAVIAAAVVYLLGGFGTISGNNIDVSISGPESVNGGEQVRWDVVIYNANSVALSSADLSFYYPAGSKPIPEIRREGIPVERKTLSSIAAGATVHETFSAFVYGAEGFEGEAKATLEYRTEGSNAIFEKSGSVKVKIIRAPVGVSVKMPAEINAGRPVDIEVRYVSNAESVINSLTLELDYPDGFTFQSASPAPSEGIMRWNIGDLAPGKERVIKITGVFEGEDKAERSVRARVGIMDGDVMDVYGEGVAGAALQRLFLDVSLLISGSASPVLHGGDTVNVDVEWHNRLSEAVLNASLEVAVKGDAVDERSIAAPDGFYRGADHTIVWTPSSHTEFQQLTPGSGGHVQFNFRVRDGQTLAEAALKNLAIDFHAAMHPGSALASLPGVDVSGFADASAKIETAPKFSASGTYSSGALIGSGPLPPKVGEETIYTVVWSFSNTVNDVVNAEVRAGVPPYVRFTGIKAPADEDISYDSVKSEIVWRVPRIRAGAGIREAAKTVQFQVGFMPSPAQVGNAPTLLFGTSATGQDEFTGNTVRVSANDITTDITQFDPAIPFGSTRVVQ